MIDESGPLLADALRELVAGQRALLLELRALRADLLERGPDDAEASALWRSIREHVRLGEAFTAAELAQALGVEDVNALGRQLPRLEGRWLTRVDRDRGGWIWVRVV